MRYLTAWLVVIQNVPADPFGLSHIDAGEREAILLAAEMSADLVLLDDRQARIAAKRIGLRITGTIGILDRADKAGLIDVEEIVRRLGSTNFYVNMTLSLAFVLTILVCFVSASPLTFAQGKSVKDLCKEATHYLSRSRYSQLCSNFTLGTHGC